MKVTAITSDSNPRLKEIKELQQRKFRRRYGLFCAEGIRVVLDFIKRGLNPCYIVIREDCWEKNQEMFCEYPGEVLLVGEQLFKKLCDTQHSQGILGIFPVFKNSLSGAEVSENSSWFVLDNLQDPGNLGTILRTVAAAGADGILLNQGCVDLYNPKTVRASMGTLGAIPVYDGLEDKEILDFAIANGIKLYPATMDGAVPYWEMRSGTPVGVILGNEGNGISDYWRKKKLRGVYIPMENNVESLNAATAAAILAFEFKRRKS